MNMLDVADATWAAFVKVAQGPATGPAVGGIVGKPTQYTLDLMKQRATGTMPSNVAPGLKWTPQQQAMRMSAQERAQAGIIGGAQRAALKPPPVRGVNATTGAKAAPPPKPAVQYPAYKPVFKAMKGLTPAQLRTRGF